MPASSVTLPHRFASLSLIVFLIFSSLALGVAQIFLDNSVITSVGSLRVVTVELLFSMAVLCDRRVTLPTLGAVPRSIRVLAFGWFLWSGCAVLLSHNVAVALVRQIEWLAHGLFVLCLCGILNAYPDWRTKLLKYLVTGFVVYATFNCVMLGLYAPADYPWSQAMLGIGNIRHFGYYAAVALVAAYAPLLGKGRKTLYKPETLILLTALWGVLCWSGSRGSVFAVLGALAVMTVLRLIPTASKIWGVTAVTAITGGLISIPFTPSDRSLGALRLFWTLADSDSLNQYSAGRLTVWLDALHRVLQHPWFGIGPNQFALASDKPVYWIIQPHNVILQAALEWGIPGAIAFFVVIAVILRQAMATTRREDSGPIYVAMWLLVMLLAQAMIDGTLYHNLPVFVFAAAAALTLAPAAERLSAPSKAVTTIGWSVTGLTSVTVALTGLSFWSCFSTGVPKPTGLRPQVVRHFPAVLANMDSSRYLEHWAVSWRQAGHEDAANDWLLWTEKHSRTPWTSMALMADWLIETGNEKAGDKLRMQAAQLVPPDWKPPPLVTR
ncbi:MAG TPA: O-antigen ligase family protein [Alphaproteobacteria bacterium]|nr:O-antigen ligase family protein [Alphaproteobacteria bacterium]